MFFLLPEALFFLGASFLPEDFFLSHSLSSEFSLLLEHGSGDGDALRLFRLFRGQAFGFPQPLIFGAFARGALLGSTFRFIFPSLQFGGRIAQQMENQQPRAEPQPRPRKKKPTPAADP